MVTTRSKKPPTSKAGTPAKPASQQEGEEDADSDDYECSDEEDLKPPPPEAVKKKTKAKSVQSGGSVSSGTSQRSRLDLHIEKQLLIDIEDQEGGLHYFDQADRLVLSRLLDTRPNIYGLRGEAIRSKIARRLRYLKQLHIRDYKLYIHSHHGLEAASLSKRQNLELERKHKNTPLKQFQRRPDTVRPIVEEAVSDLDQDEEEEDDEDSCPGSSRKPAPNTASKSVTKPNLVSSVGKRNNPSHTKIAPAASAARHPDDLVPPPPKEERPIMSGAYAMKSSPEGYPIIPVDIKKPWNNPEGIFVVPFQGHKFQGNVYSGIDIRMTADPRDINQDRLALHKHKNKEKNHQYVLTMPAVAATHWMDREDYHEDEEVESIATGYQATMVSYLGKRKGKETEAEKEQKKKRFLLEIKDENGKAMQLSDMPFIKAPKKARKGPAPDPMMIQRHYMSTYYHTGNTEKNEKGVVKPVVNVASVLSWRLADMDSEQPITQTEEEANHGLDEVDAVLAARKKRMEAKAAKAKEESGGGVHSSPPVKEEDSEVEEDEDMEDIEGEMWGNRPGMTEEQEYLEYYGQFTEDNWLIISPMLEAEAKRQAEVKQVEVTRVGATFEQLLIQICRYADCMYPQDPNHRDFQTFVVDTVIHANKEAEKLELEHGMQKAGGRIRGSLVSQEEMESQRRALFKPRPKRKKSKTRRNKKRENAQNKARNKTATDEEY